MAQKKLFRFAQIKSFSNVYEYDASMKGRWHEHFGNQNPIVLELACGRGEYALGLGKLHPHKNFIGIDVKGNRMYIGAKAALNVLPNVAFLRCQIEQVADYFAPGEVDEIWITFPDPQLKPSRLKKRLTHPRFLRTYQKFLKPEGRIHLKTDSPDLFQFTQLVAQLYQLPIERASDNIYAEEHGEELKIKTYYEGLDIAKSNRIHYVCFRLPQTLPDKDEELKQMIQNASLA